MPNGGGIEASTDRLRETRKRRRSAPYVVVQGQRGPLRRPGERVSWFHVDSMVTTEPARAGKPRRSFGACIGLAFVGALDGL
jgi:hypothetical protein